MPAAGSMMAVLLNRAATERWRVRRAEETQEQDCGVQTEEVVRQDRDRFN